MGFNNDGAAAAARRLAHRAARHRRRQHRQDQARRRRPRRSPTSPPAPSALAPLADYLVVNVSSPNTPGLRDLQAVDKLRPLLAAVRAACDLASPMRRVPLLVKIAPDLADDDVDAVADLALELGLDGIIATNTTIARTGLATPEATVAALGAGGLSGAPLKARSLAVLRRLRARVGARVTLIAVGGIETADDAWAAHPRRRHARPGLHRLHLRRPGLAAPRSSASSPRRSARRSSPSIEQAIGADAPPAPAPPA